MSFTPRASDERLFEQRGPAVVLALEQVDAAKAEQRVGDEPAVAERTAQLEPALVQAHCLLVVAGPGREVGERAERAGLRELVIRGLRELDRLPASPLALAPRRPPSSQPRDLRQRCAARAIVGRLEAARERGLRFREVSLAERGVAGGEMRARERRRRDVAAGLERLASQRRPSDISPRVLQNRTSMPASRTRAPTRLRRSPT